MSLHTYIENKKRECLQCNNDVRFLMSGGLCLDCDTKNNTKQPSKKIKICHEQANLDPIQ